MKTLQLVNESIHSAPWSIECDEKGRIAVRSGAMPSGRSWGIMTLWISRISWMRGRSFWHPEDKDRVMTLLFETAADKTNTTKFSVEYRLRLKNGQYQWFRASAEVIRRLDGTASRIAGIICNIEEEKQSRMPARGRKRSTARSPARTSANIMWIWNRTPSIPSRWRTP